MAIITLSAFVAIVLVAVICKVFCLILLHKRQKKMETVRDCGNGIEEVRWEEEKLRQSNVVQVDQVL